MLVDERVCIFVDGGNLFHSAKELGIRVDFEKLKVLVLTENQKLIRPYYYGATKKTEKQSIFFDKLREFGYEVKTLPLRSHVEGEKVIEFEKGVDVMLVTDMLVLAHRNVYDTAILVAGDKDYVYAVKALKEMGKISKRLESLYEKHPGVKPFEGITDPARWQREMRDEWE